MSFPEGLFRTLEERAKQKNVLLAWFVLDAAEQHAADKRLPFLE